jgi:hypothetical protein
MVGRRAIVATAPLPGSSVSSLVWTRDHEIFVTAIAKITLDLVAGGVADPIDPDPVETSEFADAVGCLWTAGDRAPLLVRADVLVVGQAPVLGAGRQEARLRFQRGARVLVDKRVPLSGPVGGRPLIGVLGPIPSRAPLRARKLGRLAAPDLSAEPVTVPRALDIGFFQTAASDQQVDSIVGGDWLVLEGLIEGVARCDTRLPTFAAEARLYGLEKAPGPPKVFPLRGDTLVVDVGRRTCSIVFRGHVPVSVDPAGLALVAGVQVGSRRMPHVPPPRPTKAAVGDADATLVRRAKKHEPAEAAPTEQSSVTVAMPRPKTAPPPAPRASRKSEPPPTARATPRTEPPPPPKHRAKGPRGRAADVRAKAAATELARTASLDAAALAQLRAEHAVPFEAKPRRSSAPPPPAEPPTTGAAESLGQTAALDGADLARLRAQYAVPFDPKPARSSAPPPQPAAVVPAPAPLAPPAAAVAPPPPALARPPAAAAKPPAGSGPAAPLGEPELGRTAFLASAELERLRAQHAMPFDAKRRRASAPPPGPALKPKGSSEAPAAVPAAAPAAAASAETAGPDVPLNRTAEVDDEALIQLRAQHANPFAAKASRAAAMRPDVREDAEPAQGLGEAFLAAVGEAPIPTH